MWQITLTCVSLGLILEGVFLKLLQEKLALLGHEAFILGQLHPYPNVDLLSLHLNCYNWQQGLCKRRPDTSLLVNWILNYIHLSTQSGLR